MKTLLLTSFLITGLAGTMLAKTADISLSKPVNKNCVTLVADLPRPDPTSKKVPLRADLPRPDPTSKKVPLRADLPRPDPTSKKVPLRVV
jgi:hypothetical protein